MPNKKSKKKPFPSIHDRFDAAVRKSSSVAEMLQNITREAMSAITDDQLIEALPIQTRKRFAMELGRLAIDLRFQGMPRPRASVKQSAQAMQAAEIFTAGMLKLSESAAVLPADARAEVAKAALAGALQMMGAQVSVAE